MPDQPDENLVPPLKVMRKRLNGVYRADSGFSGPTRRYVLIVALLVVLASVPTLAAITAGSNELADGTTDTMDVPFFPPASPGPVRGSSAGGGSGSSAASPSSSGPVPAGSPASGEPSGTGSGWGGPPSGPSGGPPSALVPDAGGVPISPDAGGVPISPGADGVPVSPDAGRGPLTGPSPGVSAPGPAGGVNVGERAGRLIGSLGRRLPRHSEMSGSARRDAGSKPLNTKQRPPARKPKRDRSVAVADDPSMAAFPALPGMPTLPKLSALPGMSSRSASERPTPAGSDRESPAGDPEDPPDPDEAPAWATRPYCHERGKCGSRASHHHRPDWTRHRQCENSTRRAHWSHHRTGPARTVTVHLEPAGRHGHQQVIRSTVSHRRSAVAESPQNVRAARILERSYFPGGHNSRRLIPEARTQDTNHSYHGSHRAESRHHADDTAAQQRSSRVGRHHAEPTDDLSGRL